MVYQNITPDNLPNKVFIVFKMYMWRSVVMAEVSNGLDFISSLSVYQSIALPILALFSLVVSRVSCADRDQLDLPSVEGKDE